METTLKRTAQKNETLKTIYERRAVRKYLDKPVTKEIIEALLEAGRMAPSAINKQPWKFYIVTNPDTIQRISTDIVKVAEKQFHLAHGAAMLNEKNAIFHGAPVVIFITSPKDNEWAHLDIGMCAQNIMLAAKSLGLDSCPVGMGKFIQGTPSYSLLQVPQTEEVDLALIIGYGDEAPAIHERIKSNVRYTA